ncbi:MAG: DNA recombination protein RmuC [Flavobacteriales bacterium]|nr:DNA recombination protein RmuC [Flavobacteriales bacterium]|tara:strand:+ start:19597 stop:20703 length:1107 start_codon:yes stop_codon:yes gene_type:complete
MEIGLLALLIVIVLAIYFKKPKEINDNSNKFLLQLNENLRKEIQDIRKEITDNSLKGRKEIEEKLKDINKGINTYQANSKEDMQRQFASSNKVIKEVTAELEKIKGTNDQVLGFANQMKTLEKILSNQKQRGILGEIQLENLLANVLPPELFQMQYNFKNGETVDAIVKVGDFIIPIDAKFSLDNYNRMIESEDKSEIELLEKSFKEDIKKRIDETSKYIRSSEKTTDYAYMFIPADGLYQDLLNSRVGTLKINSKDLVSYAYEKKVMIVSPMSLFPMLQITVKALHNLKVERSIDDIMKNINKLNNHLNSYKESHDKLGKTIATVVNHYNTSSKEFNKIDKDITKISGKKTEIRFEQKTLEKPLLDE